MPRLRSGAAFEKGVTRFGRGGEQRLFHRIAHGPDVFHLPDTTESLAWTPAVPLQQHHYLYRLSRCQQPDGIFNGCGANQFSEQFAVFERFPIHYGLSLVLSSG